MNLHVDIEMVDPACGYRAICYKVIDFNSREVIWRTCNEGEARELVDNYNRGKDVPALKKTLQNKVETIERLKAEKKAAIDALKKIATCSDNMDCATCPHFLSCPKREQVALARMFLHNAGQKVPTVGANVSNENEEG